VVESNIHYPTDSTVLHDGVRVLTRAVERLEAECASGAVRMVDRTRATKLRGLEITRAAKAFNDGSRTRLQEGYRRLLGIARGVVRKAKEIIRSVDAGRLKVTGNIVRVVASQARIEHFAPVVEKVIARAKARVFGGNTRVVDKIVSIFEEHTQVIRKGKAHKPTEFGRLVRVDEIENGVVSEYEVKRGNPADVEDFVPAVRRHKEIFWRAPRMATGDRGFFSADNERAARELGVTKVVLPARGRLSVARSKAQNPRRRPVMIPMLCVALIALSLWISGSHVVGSHRTLGSRMRRVGDARNHGEASVDPPTCRSFFVRRPTAPASYVGAPRPPNACSGRCSADTRSARSSGANIRSVPSLSTSSASTPASSSRSTAPSTTPRALASAMPSVTPSCRTVASASSASGMRRYCNLPIRRSPSSGPRSIKLGRDPSGNPLPSGGVWGGKISARFARGEFCNSL
jgi:IS5 family transposase